jgi:hypothetical protein
MRSAFALRLIPLLGLSWLLTVCQQESTPSAATPPSRAASSACLNESDAATCETDEAKSNADSEPEQVFSGPFCKELEIPSWDRRVKQLADTYCERCHNDRFAWEQVKLNTYKEFAKNGEAALERIRTGNLSFELPSIYADEFIQWYDAGMPETEEDCADAS